MGMTTIDATAAPTPEASAAPSAEGRSARVVFVVVVAAWIVVLGIVAAHTLYVSHDSVSNYAHVWYVADRLWGAHTVPMHMPLAHGEAFAFPYAFVPWMTAAVLWPLFGEWAVTLALVFGFIGLCVAMFWAFPELGRGWWAAAALVSPTLVIAPIIGQLPFIWAMAFAFGAIACWRRERFASAALFAALSQATHVVVMFPIFVLVVLARLRWEPQPRRLLCWYAVSSIIVIPAAAIVFASPVFGDTAVTTMAWDLTNTVFPRAIILGIPFAVIGLQHVQRHWHHRWSGWLPLGAFVVAVLANPILAPAFDTNYAWGALRRVPDRTVTVFTDSQAFAPRKTYRVLRAGDGKISMYEVLKAGGTLDSEFFPESFGRRSFSGTAAYSRFLRKREVDVVVIYASYDRRFRKNEHQLLRDLARRGEQGCSRRTVGATVIFRGPAFRVYAITRSC